MGANDGFGSGRHPLEDLVFERVYDAEGNVETRIGGEVVAGGLSRPGEIGARQSEASEVAPSDDDVAEQEATVAYDADYPTVLAEMQRRSEGFDEGTVGLVNSNHRAFNAAYAATKESMYEIQNNDRGRSGELSRLREALQEERAENPGRRTALDTALVAKIADLTTRGIY